MKIRNNSRILALVLALVMILPLISIPVFADETDAPAAPLFSENFDGKAIADVTAAKASTAVIIPATKDADAHGDVLQFSVAPQAPAEYYLWTDKNNKWAIENATVADGKVSGTSSKGEVVDAPIPESLNDTAKTVTVGGVSYKVVTGAYADSQSGAGNIASATKFKSPAITVADHSKITIEMDIFLPEDLKNTSGISGRMQGKKTSDGGNQNIELFEITASGSNATISKHENANIAKGEPKVVKLGAWVNLIFEVDFTAKHVTLLVNEEFAFRTDNLARNFTDTIASVTENTLQVQVDRGANPDTNAGLVQFDNVSIVDGLSGISYNPNAIKPVHVDFENFEVGADPSSALASNGGLSGIKVSDTYGSKAMEITFERPGSDNKLNVDKNPMIKNPAVSYDSQDKVVYEVSYFFPLDAVGQIQNQFTGSMAKVNGAAAQSSVAWVDLYQIAFNKGSATLMFEGGGDAAKDVLEKTGRTVDNGKSYSFTTGKWNTVSLVIDLQTGIYEVYLNGELIFDNVQVYRGGVCTDITIAANKIITGGKVNKVTGAGTFYIDDLKFFEGDAPSVKPAPGKNVETFEDYVYVLDTGIAALSAPKLATYKKVEDNIVVNLPIAGTKAEGALALLREDGKKIGSTQVTVDEEDETIIYAVLEDGEEWELVLVYDEWEEAYYVSFEDAEHNLIPLTDYALDPEAENYDRYFLVDANVADLAYGTGGQFGLATKIAHKKYSYATTEKVVLSADYFIEPGSKGVIEAQFESYNYDTVEGEGEEAVTTTNNGSWIQLYYFDLATGQFEGLDEYMTVGAWNNVKVIMNLVTGEYDIYLNDMFVKSEEVGHGNLTIGSNANTTFSCAKIQRTTSIHGEAYGNLMIDNVGVHTNVPGNSQYDDSFLTDEAYLNNLGNALITVEDPSFRFEDINGIRFATVIDEAFYAGILANLGENAIVNMGTLIAPVDYVELAGAFTKEALEAIEVETAKYLDIPFAEYFDGAKGVDFGEAKVFTASIVDIKEANLMRDFAAIGYITVKIDENTTRTYYAKNYATSNVVYEAKATLAAAAPFDYTEAEFAVLNAFAEADVEELIWVDVPYGSYNSPEFGETPMEIEIVDRMFYSFWGEFATLTVTGPEGFKLYYNGEFIDSVEGKVVLENVAGDHEIGGIVIGLVDAGAYSVEGVAPLGSAENPIAIDSIENAITVAVPEDGIVYCTWVSTLDGYVTVSTESALARIYAHTDIVYPDTIEGAGSVKIPVTVGTVVIIEVSTLADEVTFVSPAGEVVFALATEAGAQVTGPQMQIEIGAGEWYVLSGRAMQLAGMYLNINNENVGRVIVNGEDFLADETAGFISALLTANDFGMVSILIKNYAEEAITLDVAFETTPYSADAEKIIAGEFGNGTPIALGEGTAVSYGEGHLSWTAEAAGTFTFEITSTENWAMNITNQNSKQSDTLTSMGDIAVITFEVAAGDVLDIMVAALDFNTVEFTFVASFAAAE